MISTVAPYDPEILTEILKSYLNIFTGYFHHASGYANSLLYWIIALEVVLLGVSIALGRGVSPADIFSKIFTIGIFTFIIFSYATLLDGLFQSFLKAGLNSAGQTLSETEFLNPSALYHRGLEAAEPFRKPESAGWLNIARFIPLLIIFMVIVFSYAFMAIQVTLTILEFYIVSTLAVIFLPFGINKKTSFLADKAISGIIASGFKIMVMAAVTAASISVLEQVINLNPKMEFTSMFSFMVASMTVAMIMWRAPAIASGMISGTSNLDVGSSMIQPMVGAMSNAITSSRFIGAIGAGAVAGAGKKGIGNVASGISSVVKASRMGKK